MTKNKKITLVVLFALILTIAGVMYIIGSLENRDVLNAVPANASDEEKYDYYLRVEKMAREAEYLDITNCVSKPMVFKVQNGTKFNIRNNGDAPRLLFFPERDVLQVPPMTTLPYDALFGINRTDALYVYGCDLVKGSPAGMILTVD